MERDTGRSSGMNKRYLHFTIGPVQNFVAQSRRTRDLLVSSFLLSYLSGQAMMAVIEAGGEIEFPYVQDQADSNEKAEIIHPLLKAIASTSKEGTSKERLWIGSLPNRFKAKIPEQFDPKMCTRRVMEHWRTISEAVWNYVFAKQQLTSKRTEEIREIWDRQVNGFWDIAWAIGDDSDVLDRRKNWRSYIPTEEERDKCTLISNLQEISGYFRSKEQKNFWEELRKQLDLFDLAPNERLSAIGLIKRFFPRVTKDAIGWEFPKEAVYFPSVVYLSAFPWILRAVKEHKEEAENFGHQANQYGIKNYSRKNTFPDLNALTPDGKSKLYQFAHLEGSCFYGNWEKQENKSDIELKETYEQLKEKMKGEPTPYYAVLLMDGDRLGANIAKHGVDVSRVLDLFSKDLGEIVRKHNGVTVYAGGDDVLALLPFNKALPVAVKLREKYLDAFSETRKKNPELENDFDGTISAAVLFSHYYAPLKNVLQYAHIMLDEVAKDQCGRDSLAVAMWKRSGPGWQWAAKWEKVYKRSDESRKTILEQLAEKFKEGQETLSGSFLYKWRESYEQVPFSKEELTKLITADYLRIMKINSNEKRERAQNQIQELVELCSVSGSFKTDGALLVRFLGQKGGGY